MDAADNWQRMFKNWPASMPRQGLLVTTFEEVIPFINFMTSEGILIVERDRPDSNDARKVMISFSAIAAVKTSSTMDFVKFKVLGFE